MNKKQIESTLTALGNPDMSAHDKSCHIIDILVDVRDHSEDAKGYEVGLEILNRLQHAAGDEVYKKRSETLKEILKMLESTPLKCATFIRRTQGDGYASRALVCLDNGDMAYIVAPNQAELKTLKLGDRIMVDPKCSVLMHPDLDDQYRGHVSKLERKIDESHIEVIVRGDEREVVMVGPDLIEQINSNKLKPGDSIILGCNNTVGIRGLPVPEDSVQYFKFLDKGPIPDVRADRDIGSPPKVIEQVILHIREEMLRPELRRKYRLRPCITRLLCGVSGTGKSLAIAAIHRAMYEVMSELIGVDVDKLPRRVFRFRASQMLSMWFGESDKNIDRMFDEVEKLADQPFVDSKGLSHRIPVMVVMEEADGMGRVRGVDPIYDRVMTTTLQRLDPNRDGLANKFAVFLSTTNEPHIVDPAFLRRIGGSVETFGRLDQDGFSSILQKHVHGLPTDNGGWRDIIKSLNHWLFESPDGPIVEIHVQGSKPLVKHHKDFLTGALIDRAVQSASTKAWEMAVGGEKDSGISADHMAESLHSQVLSLVNQLTPQNVHSYLDLPEGTHVTGVRKLEVKS